MFLHETTYARGLFDRRMLRDEINLLNTLVLRMTINYEYLNVGWLH